MDMLLAAQALSKDLVLVTSNTGECERINNLKIENRVKEQPWKYKHCSSFFSF